MDISKFTQLEQRQQINSLIANPQLTHLCDFDNLDSDFWAQLLCKQPQFTDKCDFSKFTGNDFCVLLREQPQFAEICSFGNNSITYNGGTYVQPAHCKHLDFRKVHTYIWKWLLEKQPQFANYDTNWNGVAH